MKTLDWTLDKPTSEEDKALLAQVETELHDFCLRHMRIPLKRLFPKASDESIVALGEALYGMVKKPTDFYSLADKDLAAIVPFTSMENPDIDKVLDFNELLDKLHCIYLDMLSVSYRFLCVRIQQNLE